MVKKEDEINQVIQWCELRKAEAGRTPILEVNPFRDIDWLRNKTLIQIDRPLNLADTQGIVYESTTKSLYEWVNGMWRRIEK